MAAILRRSELKKCIAQRNRKDLRKRPKHLSFGFLCVLLLTWIGNSAGVSDNTSLTTEGNGFASDVPGRTERSFGKTVVEPPQRPSSYWDDPHFRPYFDNTTARNVTFKVSKPSYLLCRIRQLGDRVVSWVRQRDLHILTVGKYTYTTDQRYTSLHRDDSDDWTLEIQYTQKQDAGIYECQISTEPKMSLPIQLNVIIATAKVVEGPALYIQSGSTMNLTCVVTDKPVPDAFVFWYHNDQLLDSEAQKKRGIKVTTENGATTVSRFQMDKARATDSGNYSCQTQYVEPANITVHVLNGEKPAAMQHGPNGSHVNAEVPLLLISFAVLSSFYLI